MFNARPTVYNKKVTCIWLLSLSLSSYICIYWCVSPVTLPCGSFVGCHQVAGDTSTQDCDNTRVPFSTITWQETQIHRTVITLEFHSAPSHGRRHKYIDLWEHLSSTTKFECALMLLDLSMESSVNEDNTTTQHRNVFHCENTVCCQALQQQL